MPSGRAHDESTQAATHIGRRSVSVTLFCLEQWNLFRVLLTPFVVAVVATGHVPMQAADAQVPTPEMQSAPAPPTPEERKPAVEELYHSVRKPPPPLEVLQNLKVVVDYDLLLREDFYTEDNLKQFFDGQKVTLNYGGSHGENPSGAVLQFGAIAAPITTRIGSVMEALQLSFRRTVLRNHPVNSHLHFAVETSLITFDNVEAVFGKAWKSVLDPGSIMHPPGDRYSGPALPRTGRHAYELIRYNFDHMVAKGEVHVKFSHDSTLHYVEIVQDYRE